MDRKIWRTDKTISGHLNKVIRLLLDEQMIEMTIPDKPNSRLQQYRITNKKRYSFE